MQIEDFSKEPMIYQIGLAANKTLLARWKKVIRDLKEVDKTLDVPSMARDRIEKLLTELEEFMKQKKSKVLDLSVLDR